MIVIKIITLLGQTRAKVAIIIIIIVAVFAAVIIDIVTVIIAVNPLYVFLFPLVSIPVVGYCFCRKVGPGLRCGCQDVKNQLLITLPNEYLELSRVPSLMHRRGQNVASHAFATVRNSQTKGGNSSQQTRDTTTDLNRLR